MILEKTFKKSIGALLSSFVAMIERYEPNFWENVMNVYEFAMQMEKDGEQYYRQLAKGSTVNGLTTIFNMLADEEVKHYNVLEGMRKKNPNPTLAQSRILDNVQNVFINMKEIKDELHIDSTRSSVEYRKACTIEDKSRLFYLEKAEQAEGSQVREILMQLAEEEAKHLRIMEKIVDFVTRPEPGNWLENAEWHHLTEY